MTSFQVTVTGPEGRYRLFHTPCDDSDGKIEVTIVGLAMTWHVDVVMEDESGVVLCGMTVGSQAIWQDQFWFELRPNALPSRIEYWGDRTLWRRDSDLNWCPTEPVRKSVCGA